MSPVQVYGLTILMHLEEVEAARNETAALKRALAARPEFDLQKMFPEYFPKKERPQHEDDGGGVDPEDYKNVKWLSPKDAANEWERLSKMLEDNRGFLSGEEVTERHMTSEIEWSDWQ